MNVYLFYTCNVGKQWFVLAEGDPENINCGDGFNFFFFVEMENG